MPPLLGGFAGGLIGGGADLGNAHGSITLDVSDLTRAGQLSRTVGQQIERSMGEAASAVADYRREVDRVVRDQGLLGVARQANELTRTLGSAGRTFRNIPREIGPAQQAADEFITTFRRGRLDTIMEQAGAAARNFGAAVRGGLSGIGRDAVRIAADVRLMRTELLALGAGGAVLTAIGLRTAASLEEAEIRLRGMVGSQEEATALMEELQEQATAAGVPFSDMLSVATQMLPTLEGNTEELEKWFDIIRRTATLNQREGLAGAAFAIREALTSGGTDLVSLAERFNISRRALREALVQTGGDFQAALDIVLTQMGITTQVADEMGRSFNAAFRVARDAAAQALAAGFTPFLNALTPILQRTAEWLGQLRETSPAVLTLGASLISVVAVGAPLLLFLGRVIESLRTIRTLSIAPALGQLGVIGLALGGGAVIGNQIGRGIGRATGNEEVAETGLRDVVRTIGQLLFIAADNLTKVFVIVQTAFLAATARIVEGIGSMGEAIGRFIIRLGNFLPERLGGRELRERGEAVVEAGQAIQERGRGLSEALVGLIDVVDRRRQLLLISLGRFLGVIDEKTAEAEDISTRPAATGAGGFSDEDLARIEAWDAFQEDLADIEARYADMRLAATEQYEAQRNQIIASYNLQRLREEEDFQRQRARANARLEADISRLTADTDQRILDDWIEVWENRIPELIADSNERIAEIEADGARQRERMLQDHQDNLLTAAARLDARAVAEEQRRFSRQMSRFEEDLELRIQKERDNLAERIRVEQEGHQERIQQWRQADERRIADMRRAHAEQQRIEDEDRAIRLARQQEDREAQLAQLEAAHEARLQQIDAQERDALAARTRAFTRQSIALTTFYDDWLKTQRARQQESLSAWDNFWQSIKNSIPLPGSSYGSGYDYSGSGSDAPPGTGPGQRPTRQQLMQMGISAAQAAGWSPQQVAQWFSVWNAPTRTMSDEELARWIERTFGIDVPGYLLGTNLVPRTGLALLHEGESVLTAETTSLLRRMLGNWTQPQLVQAVAGGSSRSMVIESGAISMPIYAAAGQSAADIGHEVERALRGILTRMAS